MAVKIIVEGPRRSDVVRELFERLGDRAGGVRLVPIQQNGMTVGFKIRTHGGRDAVLAHMTGASLYRAGKYKVNVDELDAASTAIREAVRSRETVLIDEIGRMTLFSDRFREAVLAAFESDRHVVASVQDRPHGFVEKLRLVPGVAVEKTADGILSRLTEDRRPL